MKVIIPCCGSSSRFPDLPPKWMLPDHSGRPMIAEAISLLNVADKDIIVTILEEHQRKFEVNRGLKKAIGGNVQVVVLKEKTRSQSETVYKTIVESGLKEPFLVKDSDNCFRVDQIEEDCSYVCYDSLNNHSLINPRNKSYLQLDGKGVLTNIKEKQVISDTFSVGGYYFSDPEGFVKTYLRLEKVGAVDKSELYLSDVILSMLMDGVPFKGKPVTSYQDWGTVQDWKRFLLSKKTYFVSLDGYVFERGSDYFEPTFENAKSHPKAVENIKQLMELGHSVVLLSIRSRSCEELTMARLRDLGLEGLTVLFDCPLSKWELVAPPYRGISFRSCEAHELEPGAEDGIERLLQ
jgi:hypothetical protein